MARLHPELDPKKAKAHEPPRRERAAAQQARGGREAAGARADARRRRLALQRRRVGDAAMLLIMMVVMIPAAGYADVDARPHVGHHRPHRRSTLVLMWRQLQGAGRGTALRPLAKGMLLLRLQPADVVPPLAPAGAPRQARREDLMAFRWRRAGRRGRPLAGLPHPGGRRGVAHRVLPRPGGRRSARRHPRTPTATRSTDPMSLLGPEPGRLGRAASGANLRA